MPSFNLNCSNANAVKMTPTNEKDIGMSGKLSGDDYAVGDLHDDRALLRKVDWRILPVMFLTYFLQFVDKISLNVGGRHSLALGCEIR